MKTGDRRPENGVRSPETGDRDIEYQLLNRGLAELSEAKFEARKNHSVNPAH
jgi:hypothetical protein